MITGIMLGMCILSALLAIAILWECRKIRKLANHMSNQGRVS